MPVHVFGEQSKLFAVLATHLVEAATTALRVHGRFWLALSGGSTPALFYRFLANHLVTKRTDVTHWYFFLVDERVVPDGHADSNYSMIKHHLFDLVAIPPENLFPMVSVDASATAPGVALSPLGLLPPASLLPSAEQCAQNYTEILHRWIKHKPMGVPQFDYLLLGLGADGHTASLFPGATAPNTQQSAVIPVSRGPDKPARVSLSASVLRAARQRVFLVTGSAKANIVHKILTLPLESVNLPAFQITQGLLSDWFLDTDSAALLSANEYTRY